MKPLLTFSLAFVLFASLLLPSCGDDKKSTEPPVNLNRVTVAGDTTSPAGQLALEISIHSQVPLLLVELPLRFEGTGIAVDSVAFARDFLPSVAALTWKDADPEPMRVDAILTAVTPVAAGDHLFATIYLTAGAHAPAQTVGCAAYEYVNDILGRPALHSLAFGTPTAQVIRPSFSTGDIRVFAP